jgi:hypothetical protein
MGAKNEFCAASSHWEQLQDREIKYFDQMYLSAPERDHIRNMIIADLLAQGCIEAAPAPVNDHRP